MDELFLLQSLKRGDDAAFTLLYKKYWSEVYNFSRLYLNTKEAAEEVVQEVFVKLWELRETLRPEENFKGFLFIITRNVIFNQHRKQVNEIQYKMSLLEIQNEELYHMEDELEKRELREFLDRLISRMPEQRQIIFNLKRYEDLSYREIATRLNITERMVERNLYKAMKFLKENIYFFIVFLAEFEH